MKDRAVVEQFLAQQASSTIAPDSSGYDGDAMRSFSANDERPFSLREKTGGEEIQFKILKDRPWLG